MINLIHCDHAVCQECFVSHFTLVVGEKSIKHCNCLVCGEPDMTSDTIDMDLYLQMFSALIQANMAKEHYDMFTKKVNERTMMKDPGFRWCIKVSYIIASIFLYLCVYFSCSVLLVSLTTWVDRRSNVPIPNANS